MRQVILAIQQELELYAAQKKLPQALLSRILQYHEHVYMVTLGVNENAVL